jgi:hypothetical protein
MSLGLCAFSPEFNKSGLENWVPFVSSMSIYDFESRSGMKFERPACRSAIANPYACAYGMDVLSRVTRKLQDLPDPLIYTLIAIAASGAVYSTVQHAKNWEPRSARDVQRKGKIGSRIEDCTAHNKLVNDSSDIKKPCCSCQRHKLQCCIRVVCTECADSRAKKILVERVLTDPSCRTTLLARLESVNLSIRTEALTTLLYIFEFKYKTRRISQHYRLILDFRDNKTLLQVLAIALLYYESLFIALSRSIEDPFATQLAIQNITFLMRMHKPCRHNYARDPLFIEWRQNLRNPLYSLESVEGLLVISEDDPSEDIFLPEVQQFIYYIGEPYWPLQDLHPLRVVARFQRIWGPKRGNRPPMLPNNDLGEHLFSYRESPGSENGDRYHNQDIDFGEFLND